jgi:2,4-dienoyl-CoA reductase (NADPH2)
VPAHPEIPGIDHPKVLGYLDVLRDKKPVGQRVALIGAGGIGFDVAEYLLHKGSPSLDAAKFFAEWGVDTALPPRRAAAGARAESPRKIYLLQRKTSKVGDGLGKTTGWIHRTGLKNRGVEMIAGVHLPQAWTMPACTSPWATRTWCCRWTTSSSAPGQDPSASCRPSCRRPACAVHLIGGADKAAELDAKRAIKQGTELALALGPAPRQPPLRAGPCQLALHPPPWPRAWRAGTRWWPRRPGRACPTSCTARRCSARPWRTRRTPARRRCS